VTIKPQEWPELENFLPPLASYEADELKKSIKEHGVLQEIFVLPDGRIIDGYHRWRYSNGKAPAKVLKLNESEAFNLGVILNVARRNMTPLQIRDAYKNLPKVVLALRKTGKTQQDVADITGVPRPTISKIEKRQAMFKTNNVCEIPDCRVVIRKEEYEKIFKRSEAGETQEQVAADYKTTRQRIGQIVSKLNEEKKFEKMVEMSSATSKDKNNVVCCDISNITEYVKPNSVDLVLTDPPYAERFKDVWEKLGKTSNEILKPSGVLVAYCGQVMLPFALNELEKHLKYFWTAALLLKERTQFFQRPVASYWKPILIFYKPPFKFSGLLTDTIQGSGKEKLRHPWQQSLGEIEQLIKTFTKENDFVVDPLCGSGTTLLAARNTKRRFFGSDMDSKAVKNTLARLMIDE